MRLGCALTILVGHKIESKDIFIFVSLNLDLPLRFSSLAQLRESAKSCCYIWNVRNEVVCDSISMFSSELAVLSHFVDWAMQTNIPTLLSNHDLGDLTL